MHPAARFIRRHRARLAWSLLAVPGLLQLGLLAVAVGGRLFYPFDLEWMEGGMLAHAHRIASGEGIYVEPSIDFIPYLYTPLYPALLAALEPLFGISYAVARAVSVLSLLAIVALIHVALLHRARPKERWPALAGALLACGFLAATYPWVEGWYDIARADTLFLALVLGGLVMLTASARTGTGWRGHARVGTAAAVLALSFFCKQTGVLYVAAGGFVLLVMNWRRVPVYVAVAGFIGLFGTWLMNRLTGGWFWTYIFEVHQAHDTNSDRFWKSFDHILWHFPALTLVIAAGLIITFASWASTRARPPASTPLFVWSFVFAVSCLVGALGWATQWAHFNAYIPAMVTGGLAAGAAIPAIAGALDALYARHAERLAALPAWACTGARALPRMAALAAALWLGFELVSAWWQPRRFVPRAADVEAGHRLIERIRAIEGEVFMPFHPWYPRLAGKPVFTHRMGVMDVSYAHPDKRRGKRPGEPPPWRVQGLSQALERRRFAAVIWDNRPVDPYFARLRSHYRVDELVPRSERPRLYTGAKVVPKQIWVPNTPAVPPPGASVLWNFESGDLDGWTVEGTAWGKRPVVGPMAKQGQVQRFQGKYFVSSMHGGDGSKGVLRSPAFTIQGSRISLRLSGGAQPDLLRAELEVAGQIVHSSTGQNSERMDLVEWDVSPYRGQPAHIVLVDASDQGWGHLNVDEIWQWQ